MIRSWAERFLATASSFFRERVSDVWDLERRVLRHLLEELRAELAHLDHEAAIVAHDLTPSQTASLDREKIRALVTDAGGRTSHTAILARSVGIPAVVGVEQATATVSRGDTVIVDGNRGLLIVNPDPKKREEYERELARFQQFESSLTQLRDLPAVTTDGTRVALHANIELSEEIPVAMEKGSTGIGLYRTEFLFLSTETEPDEETQLRTYKEAVEQLGARPVTIRTLDLGADKFTQARSSTPERNPFLGCRSIRFCLQHLSLFKTHLRAILRATPYGDVRVMFPLITNVMELRQAKMVLHDVMEDLEEEGIPFDPDTPVGIMIEVPSVALMAKAFVPEVDFVSIGTNDLIQYTLAVDRSNEYVANLYSSAHPAVVRLIKNIIRAAQRGGIDASCCGEMAGEPEFVPLLLGMGLRTLSMTPQAIPETKQVVRSVSIEQCEKIARRVASYDSEREVINYLRRETRKLVPEAFDSAELEEPARPMRSHG